MFAEIRSDGERPTIDGHIVIWHTPLDSPQPLTDVGAWAGEWDDDGPIFTDADQLLAAAGFRRVADEWEIYDWGYRADVERLTPGSG